MAVDPRARGRRSESPTTDAAGDPLPPAALQWEDLSRNQQTAVNAEMRRLGVEMPGRFSAMSWNKRPKNFDPDEILVAHPTTLRSATNARRRWVEQAESEARMRNELEELAGSGRHHAPRGLNWYGEHRQRYADIAEETGLPTHQVVQAGTLLSPNNSPETEQRSARGAAVLASRPDMQVTVSPEHSSRILEVQTKGAAEGMDPHIKHRVPVEVPPGTHRVGDLTSEQLAVIGSTANMAGDTTGRDGRNDVRTGQRFDVPGEFRDLASIRNRTNATKGLRILRGESSAAEESHPVTAPKVTSYGRSTQTATPHEMEGSYEDWLRRDNPTQEILDLGWERSHDTHTAEDSWMHGMSHASGSPEVAKPIGTYDKLGAPGAMSKRPFGRNDPRQLGVDLESVPASHAWNNVASRRAAAALGYSPQSTQAVAWTAQRIAAGQDPAYNAELREWNDAVAAREMDQQNRPAPGATAMFVTDSDGQLQPNPKAIVKSPRKPRS